MALLSSTCANCGIPAKLECSSCKDAPAIDDIPIVRYCNANCQRTHWNEHKSTCQRLRDRTTLYRVAGMAQRLFYVAQELCWIHFRIVNVEKDGIDLVLRGTMDENSTWPASYREFPYKLFTQQEDREAALSFLGCSQALIFMVEFIAAFLGGVVTEVEEFPCKTKNDKRRTRLLAKGMKMSEAPGVSHSILKLTLRSGEQYAVDLTGAQFGYHEPVELWDTYFNTRILWKVFSLDHDLAPAFDILQKTADYTPIAQFRYVENMPCFQDVHLCVLAFMTSPILAWQYLGNLSLKKMWKLPSREFADRFRNLMDFVECKLSDTSLECVKRFFTVRGREMDTVLQKRKGRDIWDFGVGEFKFD